ncbi:ankyrin repeat domain-containing protein [Streptomyces sp. PmtG]
MDLSERLRAAAEAGDAVTVADLLAGGAAADARGGAGGPAPGDGVAGARGQVPGQRRRTALDAAVGAGHAEVVRLLLAAGADPEQDVGASAQETPLVLAAARGDTGVVRLLLDAGAHPDTRRGGAATALMVAAMEGHTDAVALLLDRGADLEREGRGRTALEWAAFGGRLAVVRLLLARGARQVARARTLAGEECLRCRGREEAKERGRALARVIVELESGVAGAG